MINLLPYEKRISLKALYRRRLIVIGFICIAAALMPLVLVLGVLSYVEYTEASFLGNQYTELESSAENGEAGSMVNQIRSTNAAITSFQKDFANTNKYSENIEKISTVRPSDISINKFNMSNKDNKKMLVISGVSGTRDSIIDFGNILDKKNGGMCSSVTVPVTTYARKVDVPFNITCEL